MGLVSSSPDGASWLLKALHPAEPSVAGTSVPDGTALDTARVEFTMTTSIGPTNFPTLPTVNWAASLYMMPHPICPLSYDIVAQSGNENHGSVRVPAFTGSTFNYDILQIKSLCQEWRLCAQSVTIHLDANATTDTGTVVASLLPLRPSYVCTLNPGTNVGYTRPPSLVYNFARTVPTYEQLMAMPRAYQANVKTGLYMPMKLTNTSQHWYSGREAVGLIHDSSFIAPEGNYATAGYGHLLTSATPAWPFNDLNPTHVEPTAVEGGLTPCFMADKYGLIQIKNIDRTSALVVKIKLCLELQVHASSPFVCHLQPPSCCDPLAIQSYFRIVRELPDAYPADYNDNGKILGLISNAIKAIGPALNLLPGVGPLLYAAVGPTTKLMDYSAKRMTKQSKKRKQKSISAPVTNPSKKKERKKGKN